MTIDANSAVSLNRVYLPIPGFMKKYKFPGVEGMFRDVTSFAFIVEALVAHSAWEIALQSYGEKSDGQLLENVPLALRKRIRFIDKENRVLKLAMAILSPVFDEFSVKPQGYALIYHKGPDSKVVDAIATTYFDLHPFLLGLRHKYEVDINISRFKEAVSTIRQESRNSEARSNMSILEGILNCYKSLTIDALRIVPSAAREQVDLFLTFLEDSTFEELAKARFGLGLPLYLKKSLIRARQLVRKIVSSEKFRPLFNASLQPIQVATRVPLPDAELVRLMVPSDYLPPIVSLEPILEQARMVWEARYGDEDLAERYERSTGERLS